jgi:hypothetical protein
VAARFRARDGGIAARAPTNIHRNEREIVMRKHTLRAASIALAPALGASMQAAANTWPVVQDAYVYEFLGNQGAPDGDSEGILVWNHEANHGAKALLQIDGDWVTDPALTAPFTATLHLYQACEPGDFIAGCPGDPGATEVNTDLLLQDHAWAEDDPALSWGDINEDATGVKATITQTNSEPAWIEVDVTAFVQAWLDGAPDHGIALSQEAYPVIRSDAGAIPVGAFCDTESSTGICATGDFAPFLVIEGAVDGDEDGVPDGADNCTEVANPDQRDTNGDGYGNLCDPDLDGNGIVNFVDLGELKTVFFTSDPDADFNDDGFVNFLDLGTMKALFFQPPGPSGIAP